MNPSPPPAVILLPYREAFASNTSLLEVFVRSQPPVGGLTRSMEPFLEQECSEVANSANKPSAGS